MFASPLWLYALFTLAIPLALHLWSRRPRRLIRVGSLRHVADLTEARSWSARLTEPLLLALRLALLASIVLSLAAPRLGAGRLDGRVHTLVLVEPALLRDPELVRSDSLLDSLARSRATVRLLQPGLERLQLDGVHSGEQIPAADSAGQVSIWESLLAADELVSPGGEILVIARPRVVALGGRRPRIGATVTWHVPAPPPPTSWVAGRWTLGHDSVFEITGSGDGHATRYIARTVASSCGSCRTPARVRLAVASPDSITSHRLRLAAYTVGTLLGQAVEPAPSPAEADLVLGSIDGFGRHSPSAVPSAAFSQATIASLALADSVLAHWPGTPLVRDPADPRQVSLAQALPVTGASPPVHSRDARTPLLLFALLLFIIERWLATRPRRAAS